MLAGICYDYDHNAEGEYRQIGIIGFLAENGYQNGSHSGSEKYVIV